MKIDTLTHHAIKHTLHCLLGCSIGEILGMMLSRSWGWGNVASIVLSVALAFLFGYGLTFRSVYKVKSDVKAAAKTTLATDTASIVSMETVDNLFILLVPGAINAGLKTGLFWWSLIISLIVAFVITVPVNYFFISRGVGHSPH